MSGVDSIALQDNFAKLTALASRFHQENSFSPETSITECKRLQNDLKAVKTREQLAALLLSITADPDESEASSVLKQYLLDHLLPADGSDSERSYTAMVSFVTGLPLPKIDFDITAEDVGYQINELCGKVDLSDVLTDVFSKKFDEIQNLNCKFPQSAYALLIAYVNKFSVVKQLVTLFTENPAYSLSQILDKLPISPEDIIIKPLSPLPANAHKVLSTADSLPSRDGYTPTILALDIAHPTKPASPLSLQTQDLVDAHTPELSPSSPSSDKRKLPSPICDALDLHLQAPSRKISTSSRGG